MQFAYWEPPPQGGYSGKIHIAKKDGESQAMLCGKRVTSAWTARTSKAGHWLCMTCELRLQRIRRAELREALEHEQASKKRDADGVPAKFFDVRLEYLEGFAAGKRGTRQEYPIHAPDTSPMYYERKGAWDAGVRDGRKARRAQGTLRRAGLMNLDGSSGN